MKLWKKIWRFLWHDDSAWSWIANLAVAFVVIRFLVYPLLSVVLGTSFPIVAVVSESMEHGLHNGILCGQPFDEYYESFDSYWRICGSWYENKGISKEEFRKFPFRNGFDKGDVIILWRAGTENLQRGDVLVFQSYKPQPIIHRIVNVWEEEGQTFYQTKGDHNSNSIPEFLAETQISEDRIYGQGVLRIPYLGWVKILFVEAVRPLGIVIER